MGTVVCLTWTCSARGLGWTRTRGALCVCPPRTLTRRSLGNEMNPRGAQCGSHLFASMPATPHFGFRTQAGVFQSLSCHRTHACESVHLHPSLPAPPYSPATLPEYLPGAQTSAHLGSMHLPRSTPRRNPRREAHGRAPAYDRRATSRATSRRSRVAECWVTSTAPSATRIESLCGHSKKDARFSVSNACGEGQFHVSSSAQRFS